VDFINPVLNAVDAVDLILAGLVILASITPTDKDDGMIGRVRNLWAKVTSPVTSIFRPKGPLGK
jgi:hypothetical protein